VRLPVLLPPLVYGADRSQGRQVVSANDRFHQLQRLPRAGVPIARGALRCPSRTGPSEGSETAGLCTGIVEGSLVPAMVETGRPRRRARPQITPKRRLGRLTRDRIGYLPQRKVFSESLRGKPSARNRANSKRRALRLGPHGSRAQSERGSPTEKNASARCER